MWPISQILAGQLVTWIEGSWWNGPFQLDGHFYQVVSWLDHVDSEDSGQSKSTHSTQLTTGQPNLVLAALLTA